MANDPWKTGPQSTAEAQKLAQQSQKLNGKPNTSNWSHAARQNYYRTGGK